VSKRALLIGVNNYGEGFPILQAPHKDVNALAEVLEQPDIGGFDRVQKLLDPDPQEMEGEIRDFFQSSSREDLVLLYFSGHGTVDLSGSKFFLGTSSTCKSKDILYQTTVISTELIYEIIDFSPYRHQIIILDCCHSGAFGDGLVSNDGKSPNIKQSLQKGSKRSRVILASCMPNQSSYEPADRELSLYTHHLVAGLKTGVADLDLDGRITTEELHYYIKSQFQSEAKMHPEILSLQLEAGKIVLVEATSANQYSSEQLLKQQRLAACLRHRDDLDNARQIQLELEIDDRLAATIYTRIGQENQQQSQLNRAITLYRTALQLNPNELATHQALGDVLCWQNKWAEAQTYYQYIIDRQPQDSALALAYHGLGNTESNQNHLDAAFSAYSQANQLDPRLANVYIDWGIALYQQGKFELAIDKLKMAIHTDDLNPRAHHFLGVILSVIGQIKASDVTLKCAIELWQTTISANPYNSSAYGLLANALTSQLKFTEAEAAARKAIELNPCNAEAYNALGNILFSQQKIEAAIEAYTQSIKYHPYLVIVHANLGFALSSKGDFDGALAKYEHTLTLNPYLFDTYRRIGDVFYAQGKFTEAIQPYRKAIEINRYDVMTLHQLASVLKLSGRHAEADTQNKIIIATAQRAIADDSTDLQTHYVLAEALASQGRFTEAMSIYLRISDADYQSPYIHGHLGNMLLSHGELEAARKEFEIAISQSPKDGFGFYGLGEVLRRQNQPQLAIVQYQQSIHLNPNLPQPYVSLGHIYLNQNELDKAGEYYQRAIDLNPYEAWNYHSLAVVLVKQRNLDLAIDKINQAISINSNEATFFNDLADIYAKKGDVFTAIEGYRTAINLQPTNPLYYYHLGCGLEQIGELNAAVPEFRMAVRLGRAHQDFTTPLIRALYRLANESPYLTTAQKKQIYQEIIIYDPNNPFWHKLISDLDMEQNN
jgi:tetratricopeptide (TPR) repeat protein